MENFSFGKSAVKQCEKRKHFCGRYTMITFPVKNIIIIIITRPETWKISNYLLTSSKYL